MLAAFVALMTVVSTALYAQSARSASTHDGVRLVVSSNKSVVAPFEPVILSYDVENVSKDAQDVPDRADHELGWIKFEISDETGTFRPYRTGIEGCAPLEFVTLKPSARLSGQVIVLTNAFGRAASSNPTDFADVPVFPFGKPGNYKVRVTFPLERSATGDSRRQLVEVLRITVKESKSAAEDLKRFASVDDLAAAVGADADDMNLTDAIPRWERIVESAPSSVFAPFVHFNVAKNYQYGVETAPPDDTRAAAHFWSAANGGLPALADDALVGFAEAQIELGNYVAATTALNRVLSEYPTANSRPRAVRLRDGLNEGKRSLREM